MACDMSLRLMPHAIVCVHVTESGVQGDWEELVEML